MHWELGRVFPLGALKFAVDGFVHDGFFSGRWSAGIPVGEERIRAALRWLALAFHG